MECAKRISKDVIQFMQEANLDEAYLFGGAVLDPLISEQAKVSDYDICVKSSNAFYETLHNLEKKDFEISEVMKTHNIYVVMKHPTLGQIDFSCMDPEDNGIYNIEKIYAKFYKKNNQYMNAVIDKYGAIDSIKRGEIRISSNPEDEGAYNILRRFLAISSKYNLDISKGSVNQPTIDKIKQEFENCRYYVPQDRVRCLSRLAASLRRSKDRTKYVKNLGEQNIFEYAYPEVHKLFNNSQFYNNPKLNNCETQKELLELMLENVQHEDRDALMDCLMILSRREKARQDKGVKTFVKNMENEKTSPQRLNKKLLNPLFKYIIDRGK